MQLVGAGGICPPTLSLFTGLREMRLGRSILQGLSVERVKKTSLRLYRTLENGFNYLDALSLASSIGPRRRVPDSSFTQSVNSGSGGPRFTRYETRAAIQCRYVWTTVCREALRFGAQRCHDKFHSDVVSCRLKSLSGSRHLL